MIWNEDARKSGATRGSDGRGWHGGVAVYMNSDSTYLVVIRADITPDAKTWVARGKPGPQARWLEREPIARFNGMKEAVRYVEVLWRLEKAVE